MASPFFGDGLQPNVSSLLQQLALLHRDYSEKVFTLASFLSGGFVEQESQDCKHTG